MKAYKGTDKNLQCKGLQYELGKEIVHNGDVSPCQNGLHACENPLDVLAYYIPADGSRYFEVDCEGEIKHHTEDSKIACSKITLKTEIGLLGLIKTGIEMIFERVKKIKPEQYTSGYQSTAIATGKKSLAVANGYRAKAKGNIGCYLTITEYSEDGNLVCVKTEKVDGQKIKPDTFYMLVNGEFTEDR